ncbi:hypothetical protein ABTN69_19865, partial [Acinetobacter baumannii]
IAFNLLRYQFVSKEIKTAPNASIILFEDSKTKRIKSIFDLKLKQCIHLLDNSSKKFLEINQINAYEQLNQNASSEKYEEFLEA